MRYRPEEWDDMRANVERAAHWVIGEAKRTGEARTSVSYAGNLYTIDVLINSMAFYTVTFVETGSVLLSERAPVDCVHNRLLASVTNDAHELVRREQLTQEIIRLCFEMSDAQFSQFTRRRQKEGVLIPEEEMTRSQLGKILSIAKEVLND